MCMQSMNLIWPSMWSGGVLTDDDNDDDDDDDDRRQTNQDCIGSRPTFCREPKITQNALRKGMREDTKSNY